MKKGTFSSLKVDCWPDHDRRLWLDARVCDDLWDDTGLAADWRPATVANVEYHYGTFLWWLRSIDWLDPGGFPVDRASPANLRDFVEAYSVDHALSSVAAVVCAIGDFLRVTSPEVEVRWIYTRGNRVKRRARPVKPAAQRRVPAIDLMRLGDALTERGKALIDEALFAGAMIFRDGLMIVAEISLPLRRRNFAALRLGASLVRDEVAYRVRLRGAEMKNGRDFDGWYPESLTSAMDYYVDHIRPILRCVATGPDAGWFWLNRSGRPMSASSIAARLRELIQEHLGVPLAFHSFRHSATTDITIHDPEHAGIAKSVLGHASSLSADHYDLAAGYEAASRYQAILADLRKRDCEE